jgi:hypothetical protein
MYEWQPRATRLVIPATCQCVSFVINPTIAFVLLTLCSREVEG